MLQFYTMEKFPDIITAIDFTANQMYDVYYVVNNKNTYRTKFFHFIKEETTKNVIYHTDP